MKVTRLPVDPGPAGWNRVLADPGPVQPLEHSTTADWIIIGAGFAGLAAARRLSQLCPGDRITVLEASRVGDGPAGRNSGFMIDLPHDLASDNYGGEVSVDRMQTQDNRHAIAFAADMANGFGLSDEAFVQSGKINAAATAKGHAHNLSYSRHLTAMSEDHQMLDADQMRDMTGIGYYQSGLFTPGAAMIQPAMFVRGVANGLRSNSVSIFENSPVTQLHHDGQWIAQTPQGQVTAPKVILAVNGHLNSFGFLANQLMHVFTYASMTRALTPDEVSRLGGHPIWAATPADPMGTTVRRISGTGGDRIVIRNRFTLDTSMQVNPARIARVGRSHDRAFAARFGMLQSVEMEYRWGGRLCLSRNNVQVVRELQPGLYSACCQNGLGTVKGTLAGMLAAELACGHNSAALDRALAAPDPRPLPPNWMTSLGANAYMRWSERKAGAEF
jgi:glycine/D-amino acid oxidase-like deaminating enzyme